MTRVGVITGVKREAACLDVLKDRAALEIRVAGASPARAAEQARELADAGVNALLSFGLCGGLDPAYEAGAVVIPEKVAAAGGKPYRCDPDWCERLEARLAGMAVHTGMLLVSTDTMVASPERKAVLRSNTDAAVVDMESHAVARVAAEVHLPFVAIRAVSDPARSRVPEWVEEIVSDAGGTHGLKLLGNLARHPRDMMSLIGLGRGSNRALRNLRRVALLAGPGLAFG